jgi:hypothetical protein
MGTSLADIRAKLQKIEDRKSGKGKTIGDGATFPFWNIQTDESATVRFLPDANEDNTFFWVERQVMKFPFPGIKGHDEDKEVTVQVPCVEMWGDTCPVHTEIRPWFDDAQLDPLARKYWKKRSYFFQGFVQNSPLDEDAPENPIRKFSISPQLFNIIKAALMDPDMEELPTDYINGVDFKIVKTQKGKYADYTTSNYARKDSALTEEQLAAVEEHGLKNLADYLPNRPNDEEVNAIFEMFQASVEGELYDPEKWAKYYKPWGFEYNGDDAVTEKKDTVTAQPAATTSTVKVEEKVEAKVEETPAEPAPATEASGEQSVQDILALVRNRNQDNS